MSYSGQRISTDAKIVLERAGYSCKYAYIGHGSVKREWLKVYHGVTLIANLRVAGACVQPDTIERLLSRAKKHHER